MSDGPWGERFRGRKEFYYVVRLWIKNESMGYGRGGEPFLWYLAMAINCQSSRLNLRIEPWNSQF
jgi:hypothetical protein